MNAFRYIQNRLKKTELFSCRVYNAESVLMFVSAISDIMYTKPSAPANSEAAGISVIEITVPLLQDELPLPERVSPALQRNSPLQQNGWSPARSEGYTRRASYAERRLSQYL